MRALRAGLLSISIIAVCASLASAQTVPPAVGSDLLRSCNALIAYAKEGGDITADATSCAAYLKGLRDAVEAAPVRSPPDKPFCAAGAGLDEMARAVVKHLQDRAESARRHASGEAFAALNRAYPCTPRR